MYVVKVEGNHIKLYDANTGAFKRSISVPEGVVSAQIEGDLVNVTTKKGKVKIYDAKTGAFKRSI